MARQSYSPETKAQAITRVLAGESATAVERELGLSRGIVQKWLERDGTAVIVAPVVATPPARTRDEARSEQMKDDMAALMHAKMQALARQAEYYGSDEWIKAQPPATVMESTRTLFRHLVAALDRLSGRGPEDSGSGSEAGD